MIVRLISMFFVTAFLLGYDVVEAQQIVLDEPIKAGELTLFPDMEDPNALYYLPDKPRIATGDNGKPQFSFLRYVENTTSSDDNQGQGGGIVHAVIVLEVTDEQKREAEQELRRIRPNAKIAGPIVYTGGTMALISSIAQPNGEFAKTVLGIGKAPILDGHKAAVSILLTKLGAKILHASFQTPTPDLSVSFDMTISGFRKPKRAIIEANFDMVYEHKSFQAAVAAPILAAEVNTAFDDLVQSGAIKVINKGADEQMERLIDEAYNKLTRMMFEPANGTGAPNLNQLTSAAGGRPSIMDRATNLLNTSRREAREENREIRAENRRNAEARANVTETPERPADRPESDETEESAVASNDTSGGGSGTSYATSRPRRGPSTHASTVDPENPAAAAGIPAPREEVEVPQIAIAACFEMRKVRQKGTYRIDLEKWSADNLSLRFDENFGQIDCDECFVDVNLDDPLYRQREITATLDGMDAPDFGQYINFVNISMKKEHENGDVTLEEIKVDRENFNQEGNNFKLVYGWKGDSDRSAWQEYQYKTVWNFFGGGMIQSDWEKTDIHAIPLSAPYVRREILVDADPTVLMDNGVRAIEIKVFYKVGEKEMFKQLRMNTRNEEYSTSFDIITPKSGTEFEYDVTWYLNDGSTRKSGRTPSTASMLFVDQLPNS